MPLLGYWRGENNANDSSGNGRHGAWDIGVAGYNTGKVGQSLEFDGTNRVAVPATGLDIGSGDFSINFWAYQATAGLGTLRMLLSKKLDDKDGLMFNVQVDNKLYFAIGAGGNWQVDFPAKDIMPVDDWIMLTITRSGNTFTLYSDNASVVSSASYAGTFGNYDMTFGYGQYTDRFPWPFVGRLDEIRVYDHALSVGEIQALYSATATTTTSSTSSTTSSTSSTSSSSTSSSSSSTSSTSSTLSTTSTSSSLSSSTSSSLTSTSSTSSSSSSTSSTLTSTSTTSSSSTSSTISSSSSTSSSTTLSPFRLSGLTPSSKESAFYRSKNDERVRLRGTPCKVFRVQDATVTTDYFDNLIVSKENSEPTPINTFVIVEPYQVPRNKIGNDQGSEYSEFPFTATFKFSDDIRRLDLVEIDYEYARNSGLTRNFSGTPNTPLHTLRTRFKVLNRVTTGINSDLTNKFFLVPSEENWAV